MEFEREISNLEQADPSEFGSFNWQWTVGGQFGADNGEGERLQEYCERYGVELEAVSEAALSGAVTTRYALRGPNTALLQIAIWARELSLYGRDRGIGYPKHQIDVSDAKVIAVVNAALKVGDDVKPLLAQAERFDEYVDGLFDSRARQRAQLWRGYCRGSVAAAIGERIRKRQRSTLRRLTLKYAKTSDRADVKVIDQRREAAHHRYEAIADLVAASKGPDAYLRNKARYEAVGHLLEAGRVSEARTFFDAIATSGDPLPAKDNSLGVLEVLVRSGEVHGTGGAGL